MPIVFANFKSGWIKLIAFVNHIKTKLRVFNVDTALPQTTAFEGPTLITSKTPTAIHKWFYVCQQISTLAIDMVWGFFQGT